MQTGKRSQEPGGRRALDANFTSTAHCASDPGHAPLPSRVCLLVWKVGVSPHALTEGIFLARGVQHFGVSGPHWKKKSCLGPHIKYIATRNYGKIS